MTFKLPKLPPHRVAMSDNWCTIESHRLRQHEERALAIREAAREANAIWGAPIEVPCVVCGEPMMAQRITKCTCSAKCRKRLQRLGAAKSAEPDRAIAATKVHDEHEATRPLVGEFVGQTDEHLRIHRELKKREAEQSKRFLDYLAQGIGATYMGDPNVKVERKARKVREKKAR